MRSTKSLFGGMPHCKRCKAELSGNERVCPSCDFDPRQFGFRLSGVGLLILVLSMIGAQLSMVVIPWVGPYFLALAVFGFLFAFAMFLLAVMVTPYRLGGLLTWS